MRRDFFDPAPEQQNVILVNAATLREAARLIESCEACNQTRSEIPFDWVLDPIAGSDPKVTDYILETLNVHQIRYSFPVRVRVQVRKMFFPDAMLIGSKEYRLWP
jgi:hypothetical protein